MKKLLLAFLLVASGLKAEIPAERWVGNWICNKDNIILNKDTTCMIKWRNLKIKGHYGIEPGGNLVVVSEGKAHIFCATLMDDSHHYDFEHPANGLMFLGYQWEVDYAEKFQNAKQVETLIFRRK